MSLKNNVKQVLARMRHKALGSALSVKSGPQCDPNSDLLDSDQIERVFTELSRYAHDSKHLPLEAKVSSQCQRALIDCIASIRAGSDTIEGRMVLETFAVHESLVGCSFGLEAVLHKIRRASFAMSCLSQIHDYNDGHPTSGTRGGSFHPGRVIIPCALAASKFHRSSGAQFLQWTVLGYDIALGTQYPPMQGSCDAIGAAVIFSLAYGLDPSQTAMAMKIACFLAPRTGGDDFELNHLTCAQQAAAACDAVYLVRAGYPLRAVPSRYADRFRFVKPEYAGKEMLELYFKPYPCCRYIHTLLDLAIDIHSEASERHGEITGISLTIPKRLQGPDSEINPSYQGKTLQFNFPFCVAAAVLTGRLQTSHFDPELDLYSHIVRVALNTNCTYVACDEAIVAVTFEDGFEIIKSSCVISSLGSRDNPIPLTQHEKKLTDQIIDDKTSDSLVRMIQQIESLDDLDALFELIVEKPQ